MTPPLPRLTIYTEGDLIRGLGHITRCQAYAQGWRQRGGAVDWVVDGDESVRRVLTSEGNVALAAWQTAAAPPRNGLALIDSYSAPRSTYVALAPSGGVFLDDLVRLDYPSGLVVHSAPGASATRAQPIGSRDRPGIRFVRPFGRRPFPRSLPVLGASLSFWEGSTIVALGPSWPP